MSSFDVEARLKADFSEFDPLTWVCASADRDSRHDFTGEMMEYLSNIEDEEVGTDGVEFSTGVKEKLLATLQTKEDFGIGERGDAPSRREDYSESYGASSNRGSQTSVTCAAQTSLAKKMAEQIRIMEKEKSDKEEMTHKLLDRLKGMESLAVNSKHRPPPDSGSAAAGKSPPITM